MRKLAVRRHRLDRNRQCFTESLEGRRLLASVQLVADLDQTPLSSNHNFIGQFGDHLLVNSRQPNASQTPQTLLSTDLDGGAPTTLLTFTDREIAFAPSSKQFVIHEGRAVFPFLINDVPSIVATDGSPGGTVVVPIPGLPIALTGPLEAYLATSGNRLFVAARGQIWRFEDASSSLTLIGSVGGTNSGLAVLGPHIYCIGSSEGSSPTLYRIDAATNSIANITTFSGGARPAANTIASNGTQLFIALEDSPSRFYSSDGTAAGTQLLLSQSTGNLGISLSSTVASGCFFIWTPSGGSRSLWFSDGTVAGTRSLVPAPTFASGVVMNEHLFFITSAGSTNSEVWVSDGTPLGTHQLRDLNPGPASGVYGSTILRIENDLYFCGDAGDGHGVEIYRTDGSAAGTSLWYETVAGAKGLENYSLGHANDRLYFMPTDPQVGRELTSVRLDGTDRRVAMDATLGTVGSNPLHRGILPDRRRLILAGVSQGGDPLYVFDERNDSFTRILPEEFLADPYTPMLIRGSIALLRVRLASQTIHDYGWWVTDGTVKGTKPLGPTDGAFYASTTTASVLGPDGNFYFYGSDAAHGREIWRSDGTVEGTSRVSELAAGSAGIATNGTAGMSSTAGFVYFRGTVGSAYNCYRLAPSTGVVTTLATGGSVLTPAVLTVGDRAYFNTNAGFATIADTATTPTVLKNVQASRIAKLGSVVYFTAGTTLYRSDGTFVGTTPVTALSSTYGAPAPSVLLESSSFILFVSTLATSPARMQRAFVIDEAGTLNAITPVTTSSNTLYAGIYIGTLPLVEQNGLVYFSFFDDAHGEELWSTQGTFATTQMVLDLAPGIASPTPRPLFVGARGLYLSAQVANLGTELVRLIDGPSPVVSSSTFDESSGRKVLIDFSTDVHMSVSINDFKLQSRTTGVVVPQDLYSLMLTSGASNTSRYAISISSALPDGDYRVSASRDSIVDYFAQPLSDDISFDFFVLAGDVNHDRHVDFGDLIVLSQNYGRSGRTFGQGNLDYSADGIVDFSDLVVLAQRYGATLPPPAAVVERVVSGKKSREWPVVGA